MSMGLVVGVHTHAEPDRLLQTVRSLPTAGAGDAKVVLLPDGPDAALAAALTAEPVLAGLPRCGTTEPLGPPACFNRLASRGDASVVVLVESGTVLGPGCLSLLAEALAQPGRGLAGPSTNRSWNEQAVFGGAGLSDVARTAGRDLEDTAAVYFALGEPLSLDVLLARIRRKLAPLGVEAIRTVRQVGYAWAIERSKRS